MDTLPPVPAGQVEDFGPVDLQVERRPDGSLVVRSTLPLGDHPSSIVHYLEHWARTAPERTFLAERSAASTWRTLSYADAASRASSIAQALIDRGLGPARPVMVLSGNSLDHAQLMLGAYLARVPIAPVSPAYSLTSGDFARLRAIGALVEPAMIYVASLAPFARALHALDTAAEVVCSDTPAAQADDGLAATPFDDLLSTRATTAVERQAASIGAHDVAKVLFTSGSTGSPKAVINTHGMLAANQQMIAQCWPFLERDPPVLVDWLPWNHTFGGNHNFHMVLRHGGTLYVDAGRPAPGAMAETLRNLRDVSPNLYFNVPAGFALLLPSLEADDDLARAFLKRLRLIFYAAAALPQDAWERLDRLAHRHLGRGVTLTSAWGCTETAPLATTAHFVSARAGIIGVPPPGVEIKLVPSGSKLELRVRGPNVTPGYLGRPDLTRAAFDEDGFYRTGDAGRFVNPEAPEQGLLFDGRTAEDFKLSTGTWVHVGALRVAVLAACSPVVQDAVVCGHDRDEVGLLVWLNTAACREMTGAEADEDLAALDAVRRRVVDGLRRHNGSHSASSTRVARVHVLREPPSIDANEITDKGYINQRAVLERRAAFVERLFAPEPDADVIAV